jgi:hypothetical protein
MKIIRICLILVLLVLPLGLVQAQTTNNATDFTYQGYIENDGTPVNGTCSFQFRLYNAVTGGSQIGSTLTVPGVTVTEGAFSVQLDFGSTAFNGQDRWLEISVDCGDGLTLLSPRQVVTPAAYAIYSVNSWSLTGNSGTNPASNFIGTTDSVALNFRVGGQRGLRLEPNIGNTPNVVGGSSSNSTTGGAFGATIGGGGSGSLPNQVTGN